jgi:hypothetical protein
MGVGVGSWRCTWWVEEAGVAEVLDNKGKLCVTTGVTRAGKLYSNIEDIGYATYLMKCQSCVIAMKFSALVEVFCIVPLAMVLCNSKIFVANSRYVLTIHDVWCQFII